VHHLKFFNDFWSYSRVRRFSHAQLYFYSYNPQTKSESNKIHAENYKFESNKIHAENSTFFYSPQIL